MSKRILVIPDVQMKPGVPTEHLEWIGELIVDKQPDIVVQIGDFADMPSLSSYDVGKKSFEGRRYKDDVQSVVEAQAKLLYPLSVMQARQQANKKKVYSPRLVLTLGNHEERILRAINNDPKLDGTIGIEDLCYKGFGWEVVPYLKPIEIEGVVFCHYLASGVLGRPITTANALLTKKHQSIVVGHQQGRQIATSVKANGDTITAIIAGSCYLHDEEYMGVQGNKHWRGVVFLNEVKNGNFDEMFLSLDYLKRKYGN